MLSDIPDQSDDDEGEVKFGIGTEKENGIVKEQEELLGELDWQSFVSGTKKVLSMEVSVDCARSTVVLLASSQTKLIYLAVDALDILG